MMQIDDHRLFASAGAPELRFMESPNHSGRFAEGRPDTIVIHYTAGASLESSARWLTQPEARASAHVVIGASGAIIQLLPFDHIAWHAGASTWQGRSGLNRYSLGIEIDNAGRLTRRAGGYFTTFGRRIDDENVVLATHFLDDHESPWHAFTEAQIHSVDRLCRLLKSHYPIQTIVGHDQIAPNRKRDPGPAFPLAALQTWVLEDRGMDEQPEGPSSGTHPKKTGSGLVTADYLNIRRAPGLGAPTLRDPLPRGTPLQILEHKGEWLRVRLDYEGWVSARWVQRP